MLRCSLPSYYGPVVQLSPDRVLEILSSQQWSDLIGLEETDQVECKSSPYRLEDERQKLELAKDVSGLANAAGGVIVLGLGTRRDPARALDIVRTVSAYETDRFDVTQCQNVLRDWVYPPPAVEISDYVSDERKLTAIRVREPLEKPYIVVRDVTSEGNRRELTVGYFERQQTHVAPMAAPRLQQLLRDGVRFDEHLKEIADGLRTVPVRALVASPPAAVLPDRIDEAIAEAELRDYPTFVLACTPAQQVDLRGLVEAEDSPSVQLISTPPEVRPHGFSIASGRTRLVRGELRRASEYGHRCLDVWRDGTVVFAGPANGDFLCWGTPDNRSQINPLVLAESSFVFARFVKRMYELNDSIAPLDFRLQVRSAQSLVMVPHQLGAAGALNPANQHSAPDSYKDIVQAASDAYDPQEVAYNLRRELYFWFSFTEPEVPYATEEDGRRVTDPESFG